MIKYYNALGQVGLTEDFFAALVGTAASSCYGVAGMAASGAADNVKSALFSDSSRQDKGVLVTEQNGQLIIELHLKITFGVNVSAIVQSITHKVKYTIEDATGLKVYKIHVCIDDIVAG